MQPLQGAGGGQSAKHGLGLRGRGHLGSFCVLSQYWYLHIKRFVSYYDADRN